MNILKYQKVKGRKELTYPSISSSDTGHRRTDKNYYHICNQPKLDFPIKMELDDLVRKLYLTKCGA